MKTKHAIIPFEWLIIWAGKYCQIAKTDRLPVYINNIVGGGTIPGDTQDLFLALGLIFTPVRSRNSMGCQDKTYLSRQMPYPLCIHSSPTEIFFYWTNSWMIFHIVYTTITYCNNELSGYMLCTMCYRTCMITPNS